MTVRERCDVGGDRVYRRRHEHDPRRAGGVMLPNHSPLVIAEQFGTLESLYPGRIVSASAAHRQRHADRASTAPRSRIGRDHFPQDVWSFVPARTRGAEPGDPRRARNRTRRPLWILGSSLYGAQLAAMLGLPYAFASHFAPDALMQALSVYRAKFQPSKQLEKPYAMAGVNVFAATPMKRACASSLPCSRLLRCFAAAIPARFAACRNIDAVLSPAGARGRHALQYSWWAPRDVTQGLQTFIEKTQFDELMLTGRSTITRRAALLRDRG